MISLVSLLFRFLFAALNLFAAGLLTWQYYTYNPPSTQSREFGFKKVFSYLALINGFSGFYLIIDTFLIVAQIIGV